MALRIYQRSKSDFRVVNGGHISGEYQNFAFRDYAEATTAYSVETDPRIREAIALIDPSVTEASPVTLHHAVSKAEERRAIFGKAKRCAYTRCGKPIPPTYGVPGVSLSRTDSKTLICSACGTAEALLGKNLPHVFDASLNTPAVFRA